MLVNVSVLTEAFVEYTFVALKAVVEAYGKTEAVVVVAAKNPAVSFWVPVAMSFVPSQERSVLFADMPVVSKLAWPAEYERPLPKVVVAVH
jgi:hypothetical protein